MKKFKKAIKQHSNKKMNTQELIENKLNNEVFYEIVEKEICPQNIICPDCGGITLEGLELCDKCGGELY